MKDPLFLVRVWQGLMLISFLGLAFFTPRSDHSKRYYILLRVSGITFLTLFISSPIFHIWYVDNHDEIWLGEIPGSLFFGGIYLFFLGAIINYGKRIKSKKIGLIIFRIGKNSVALGLIIWVYTIIRILL